MHCPFCGEPDTKVYDSRQAESGEATRRRRECGVCGRRFVTEERVQHIPLVVTKKDGRRESFTRDKVLKGLITACEKRPVPLETLEEAVAIVERKLRESGEREVPSRRIGEMVMEELRRIDQVAYVRFASVYRQFADVGEFREEVERLEKG